MKEPKFKLALFILGALFIIPHQSAAATSIPLTDNAGLFIINFDFLAGDEDYLIPIGAKYGLAFGSESPYAGYKIFSGDKDAVTTKSSAITLSDAEVIDGRYYKIEAGERAQFTMLVVAEVPENLTTTHYRAELSHLPYFNGTTKTAVAKERLSTFRSTPLLLNKEIIGEKVILKML